MNTNPNTYKLPNGNDILLGQNIFGVWTVSCWDDDFNVIWITEFKDEKDAQNRFEECKRISLTS
jgi:hypothetical protein